MFWQRVHRRDQRVATRQNCETVFNARQWLLQLYQIALSPTPARQKGPVLIQTLHFNITCLLHNMIYQHFNTSSFKYFYLKNKHWAKYFEKFIKAGTMVDPLLDVVHLYTCIGFFVCLDLIIFLIMFGSLFPLFVSYLLLFYNKF